MPWPSCSRSRIVMRVSHLCESEPGQPGTTSRTGPPWIVGRGSPFMAKTIRPCSLHRLGDRHAARERSLVVSPERCGSAP